jgi:hypothetical protein
MHEFTEQLLMPQMITVEFAYGNGRIGVPIRQNGIT